MRYIVTNIEDGSRYELTQEELDRYFDNRNPFDWHVEKESTMLVDPPEGWMYGFPAPLEDNYEEQLRKAGYPEEKIPMALKHSRFMGTREQVERMVKKNDK
jgi:hypothetical protein